LNSNADAVIGTSIRADNAIESFMLRSSIKTNVMPAQPAAVSAVQTKLQN